MHSIHREEDANQDADARVRRKADPRNPDDWGRFGQARRRTKIVANVVLALLLAMLLTRGMYWIWPHWVLVRIYFAILIAILPTLLVWAASAFERNQMRCPWCTRNFYPRGVFGKVDFPSAQFTVRCTNCRAELPRELR